MGPTDEEKAILTEEELAGMMEDDGDDEGQEGAEGEEGVDTGDEGEAGAAAAAPAADTSEAPGRDDGADDDDDDTPLTQPAGDRVNPDEVQTKLGEITTQKAALAEQLDDGEITTKEYTEAIDKLNDERNTLTNTLARQQEQEESVTKAWYGDVEKFLKQNPELSANQTRLTSFDAVVRRVTADPDNATLSNRKQLLKAQEIWREEMGVATPATKEEPAPGTKTGKAPKPALPPTLHNAPAAEVADSADGKFSYLDALINGGKAIEYEAALAKLSEADQQDYLSRP